MEAFRSTFVGTRFRFVVPEYIVNGTVFLYSPDVNPKILITACILSLIKAPIIHIQGDIYIRASRCVKEKQTILKLEGQNYEQKWLRERDVICFSGKTCYESRLNISQLPHLIIRKVHHGDVAVPI